jgi:hypothetical protein
VRQQQIEEFQFGHFCIPCHQKLRSNRYRIHHFLEVTRAHLNSGAAENTVNSKIWVAEGYQRLYVAEHIAIIVMTLLKS